MGIRSQLFVKPAYPTKSFADQTVIVTGSNTGLGKEAARHLTRPGAAKVILAVRNIQAGKAAKQDIENSTECGPDVVQVWYLDLSKYASVRAFAEQTSKLPRLDVLLANAGVSLRSWSVAEGRERSITINVISTSTFLLALLMLPKLKESAKKFNTQPHLVVVSSELHSWAKFPEWKTPNTFDALADKSEFRKNDRYPTSKLMEVLIVRATAPSLQGSGITLNYLNPGFCHSELSRDSSKVLSIMKFLLARSTEMGSRTLVAAASAGPESHGKYMHDGVVDEKALSSFVRSEDGTKAAEKVWLELAEILENIQPGVTTNL